MSTGAGDERMHQKRGRVSCIRIRERDCSTVRCKEDASRLWYERSMIYGRGDQARHEAREGRDAPKCNVTKLHSKQTKMTEESGKRREKEGSAHAIGCPSL